MLYVPFILTYLLLCTYEFNGSYRCQRSFLDTNKIFRYFIYYILYILDIIYFRYDILRIIFNTNNNSHERVYIHIHLIVLFA
jgi:hypothetical protein